MTRFFSTGSLFPFVFSLLLLISFTAASQNGATGLLKYTADQYGTSDILVNGWKYFPEHFNAKGDPYFNDLGWEKGSVETPMEKFDDLLLRYNIQMDELVLQKTLKDGKPAFVMLNPDFVKSFDIASYHFVNAGKEKLHPDLDGYVEVIYSGRLKFLARHSKMFVANYSVNSPQGSISGQNTTYYLLNGDQLNKILSKRSLFRLFPEKKKQIRKFLKKEKIRFKRANRRQQAELMKYLDEIL